ncbi:MAG TPA: methylated-DNA--[protein]-cysteine S-methyltransferase [Longimicrobiaceae bacterium]|nr:methylated-DNA--[protein]-cysteine S-methyltransferase [Longimicrobiaceae bacterium]
MRLLLSSPVGPLLAEYDAEAVTGLRFWRQGAHPPAGTIDAPPRGDALGARLERELDEYFAGARREFSVPLRPGGTDFQRSVWAALRRVAYGETRSYGEIARELGRPGASRAVGQANGRNPIPILIPCHRVLAADGGIGGYMGDWGAGEGVALKRWLLTHERNGRAERSN